MAEFRPRPFHENNERSSIASERRKCANNYSSHYAAVPTETNSDENDLEAASYITNFTKGLHHDEFGNLSEPDDYIKWVNEINQQDASNFDGVNRGMPNATYPKTQRKPDINGNARPTSWRGWESPRSGHYFDLQGPDPDAVGMPPAPALGSEELTAEMAEVYALALLRDVSFKDITMVANGTNPDPIPTSTGLDVADILDALNGMEWFTSNAQGEFSLQERRRRTARRIDHGSDFPISNPPDNAVFLAKNVFRGSGPGAKAGPYVSQFMLRGNKSTTPEETTPNIADSSIAYGRQVIDQKIETLTAGKDYMVNWDAYLDVQAGANFGGDTDAAVVSKRRFITTPRDLAAYVRYDALYQAYLNACLIMIGDSNNFPKQNRVKHPYHGTLGPGFPDGGKIGEQPPSRGAFATFGDPHILSLVTEVATRCLKAVRRQKFNYHRRARPERLGAALTVRGTKTLSGDSNKSSEISGAASAKVDDMLDTPGFKDLLDLVNQHNESLLSNNNADPHLVLNNSSNPDWYKAAQKYLLPMAFAEGSPMHPSYGAGHATVAGGCVTMLKAFFDTTDEEGKPRVWPASLTPVEAVLVPESEKYPSQLKAATDVAGMTISGELNKLAANISIGRDMAGVHFYTDYYESLRMGERIATGILIEQTKQYNEPLEFSFESFDGDHVHILKNDYDYGEPRVFVHTSTGEEIGLDAWWHRHLSEDILAILLAQSPNNSRSAEEGVATA